MDAGMHEQDTPKDAPESDDNLILGGEISGLDKETNWRPEKHHAVTASWLAYLLLIVLVLSFAIHYSAIVYLSINEKKDTVEALSSLFGTWLPVMSGFVGGAVTYYFTREQGAE